MTTKHLLESEIQQYATDKMSCSKEITDHLMNCQTCRDEVIAYEMIFSKIKQDSQPAFDFDLSALVMNRLPAERATSNIEKSVLYITYLSLIVASGMALYMFRSFISDWLTGITPMFFYLVITSLVSLLIFLGIDMFSKYNRQMKILN